MQGEQVEDKGKTLLKEGVETSIVPLKEIEVYEDEVAEEIKNEVEQYNPHSFPATLLPSSNSFVGLQETTQALESMRTLAGTLIKSGLCPLKKVEDVIVAIITGNQFQFPFMTSINNIFPINGKPTLSVHLQRALILRNKIIFNKLNDYEALYEWAKIGDDGKLVMKELRNAQGQTKSVPVILKISTVQDKPLELCTAIKEVDRITKYKFTRLIKLEDGSFERLEVISEFKMSDAGKAGLLEKDVWIKYPARMCDARAFAIGSREIASDVTLGISTVSELADAHNIKYTVSENFEETIQR